jgi:membrane protease YdiL (CAAX protease family)
MMKNDRISAGAWGERIVLASLFVAVGSLIMIVFSPLRPLLDRGADYLGRILLIALLLIATVLLQRSTRFQKYRPIALGLLILAVAVSLDWFFGRYLMDSLGVTGGTPVGFALLKLNECAVVVCAVILLIRISGGSLGEIYLQRGNLKLGLIVGLTAFVIAAAGAIPMATLLFNNKSTSLAVVIPWIPLLLITSLANAAQEEILFRGLFLRRLQPFFGKLASNVLIVIVFTLLHKGVTYTSNEYAFLLILIPLALIWGYLTQKTDSVWASILFHAGTDIPIFLGIFSNLT